MEILGLELPQLALIGVGLVIAIPAVIPLLQRLLAKKEKTDITDIVSMWRDLSESMHAAGLHDACEMMDEIFPLLNQRVDNTNGE
jgi:hypothetical protein